MNYPKFHSRKSLIIGIVVGVLLSIIGWTLVDDGRWLVGLFQVAVGLVLAIHCFDMLRYYKKHRIVKIEKTSTHRIVTKK